MFRSVLFTQREAACVSKPFPFNRFRTLLRNAAPSTPFPSITSALFAMQRGVGVSDSNPNSSLPYIVPRRLSDEDSRPERALVPSAVEGQRGSLRSTSPSAPRFHLPYTLQFFVAPKSFASHCGDSRVCPELSTVNCLPRAKSRGRLSTVNHLRRRTANSERQTVNPRSQPRVIHWRYNPLFQGGPPNE
jgi:hypothetical protein